MIPLSISLGPILLTDTIIAYLTSVLVAGISIRLMFPKNKNERNTVTSLVSSAFLIGILALKFSLLFTEWNLIKEDASLIIYRWGSVINQIFGISIATIYLVFKIRLKEERNRLFKIAATFVGILFLGVLLFPFVVNQIMPAEGVENPLSEREGIQLMDFKGEVYSIEWNKANPVVILNFWATWCPPCRAELPDFEQFHANYPDVPLFAVNYTASESSEQAVIDFCESRGISIPVLKDSHVSLIEKFKIKSFPTTIVFNGKGEIVDRHEGLISLGTLEGYLE